jgi:hypothetical protein
MVSWSGITFPAPLLKFRTAGFPRYGFKRDFGRDLRRRPVGLRAGPPSPHQPPAYTRSESRTRPEGGCHAVAGRLGVQAAPPALPRDAPVQRPLARRRITRRVPAYYGLIRRARPLPPAYRLRPGGSLPDGPVWAGAERLPTLLRVPLSPCRRPYPGGPSGCPWLLLPRPRWPSPSPHRLGIRSAPIAGSQVGSVTRLQRSRQATARRVVGPTPARAFTLELSPPQVASKRRRVWLHGQTANSRGRTSTG